MTQATYDAAAYGGSGPENYQKYFVPAIGAPLARDLVRAASLRPGERVLDVACGTGVVTRLAAEQVGAAGSVAGLDVNPGMIAVARATTSDDLAIDWYETGVEVTPLSSGSFDVVLCQMGLQFMDNKLQALREIRRLLGPDGRVVLNLPGPTPALFAAFADALARHIDPRCAGFVKTVFSLYDPDELNGLMTEAGFNDLVINRARKSLHVSAPEDFMWQYIHSTPMAALVANATDEQRAALADETRERWQKFVDSESLVIEVDMTTVSGRCRPA